VRRLLAQRRRSLPWSDRSILLASLLLVLLAIPLWLDPQTLNEVTGQGASTSAAPSGLDLDTPRPGGPTPGARGPAIVVALDDFDRSVDGGWGSAELGGDYAATGRGTLSVEEGTAFAHLAAGDAGTVALSTFAVHDAALEYAVSLERLPADGEVIIYAVLRLNADGAAYWLALHVTAAGDVYAGVESLVDGRARRIGASVLIPTTAGVAPPTLRVRAEAIGDDPTTLRIRAWSDGQPEPAAWQLSVIDWAGPLQHGGAIGLGWWLDQSVDEHLALGFLELAAWRLGDDA